MDFDEELDTSGLNCPVPVMRARKALQKLASGQVLHLIATDPASNDDVPALMPGAASELVASNEKDGRFHFYIKKK